MKRFLIFFALLCIPISVSAKEITFSDSTATGKITTTETSATLTIESVSGDKTAYLYIYKTKNGSEYTDQLYSQTISLKAGVSQTILMAQGLIPSTTYYFGYGTSQTGISIINAPTRAFDTEMPANFAYDPILNLSEKPKNGTLIISGRIQVTQPKDYFQYEKFKAELIYSATDSTLTDKANLPPKIEARKTKELRGDNKGINSDGSYYYYIEGLSTGKTYWAREIIILPDGRVDEGDIFSFDGEVGYIPPGSEAAQTQFDRTTYRLLAPLPGLSMILDPQVCEKQKSEGILPKGSICDINGLIAFGIKFLIGVTAVILVVRLMFEGYQYMVTDVPMLKADAKSHFLNALVGLLLALSAYLILNTINPKLVKNDIALQVASIGTSFNISGALSSSFSARPVTINFDKEAYPAAKIAAAKTGVNESFILAIFDQETTSGKGGTGRCRWTDANAKMKEVEKQALQKILTELNKNIDDTPVSCALGTGGHGGAIGYTQFLPTTWLSVKERAKTALGHTPDPWNVNDALMAAGFYLKDLNGATDMYNAACKYYSGDPCREGRQPPNKFYGDSVISKKNKYDAVIIEKKAKGVIK